MSDETSLQTAVHNDVDLFGTTILRNDAETDNSGTDIASSPEIRLDRLGLRNSFASLDCTFDATFFITDLQQDQLMSCHC